MNEFELADQQAEMEALKRAIPTWQQAKLEPFLQNPQEDVTLPSWNKLAIEPTNKPTGTGDGGVGVIQGILVNTNGVPRYASISGTLGAVVT